MISVTGARQWLPRRDVGAGPPRRPSRVALRVSSHGRVHPLLIDHLTRYALSSGAVRNRTPALCEIARLPHGSLGIRVPPARGGRPWLDRPNVQGTYALSGTQTSTGCPSTTSPTYDEAISATIDITGQTGTSFVGAISITPKDLPPTSFSGVVDSS